MAPLARSKSDPAAVVNYEGRANDASFAGVIQDRTAEVRAIAGAVRDVVYEVLPETVEVAWPRQGSIGWGTGLKKFTEQFAYMMCYKNHVTLGFYHGGDLPDPDVLLPSTGGKQVQGKLSMRSLKLKSVGDVHRPALRDLIEASTRVNVPPPHK